jgi:OOP family OmpA-OmpF porin
MKNQLTALRVALVAGVIALSPLSTNAAEGQFYLAPGLQWLDFDQDRGQDKETGFTLGFGYDFTNRLSAEINIFDMDLDGAPDNDLFHTRLDLLYNLDRQIGNLTPFIVGGVGHNRFSQNDETVFDAGIGVKYQLSDNLVWRTAIRKFWGMDEHFHDYGIDTGLVFSFGGSSAAPARVAAPTPAPAPVVDPDSDGDGVPDSRDACPDTPRNHRVDNRGCSIAVEEIARITLNVQFDFDQAVVKPEFREEVRQVAEFLRLHTDTVAVLEGHTDSMGSEEYNMDLSQRRVNAVRQLLIDQFGIDGARVRAQGFGESRPVASNDTPQGRAQNRRVESVITTTFERFQTR